MTRLSRLRTDRPSGKAAVLVLVLASLLFAIWPVGHAAATTPTPAPTLGTDGKLPHLCTPEDESNCYGNSHAGALSISPHIVHPGGQFTVDFSPVEGYNDKWDIAAMGLPGVDKAGCKAQETSCTFHVPLDVVTPNNYIYYTLNFGTKQGPAYSISYLAVISRRALTGTVQTSAGKGIQGAELSFVGPDGEETTTTDAEGSYGVVLSADTYTVSIVNLPGSGQTVTVLQCSGRVSGTDCVVDLEPGDRTASFTEEGVSVTNVAGPARRPRAQWAVGPTSPSRALVLGLRGPMTKSTWSRRMAGRRSRPPTSS